MYEQYFSVILFMYYNMYVCVCISKYIYVCVYCMPKIKKIFTTRNENKKNFKLRESNKLYFSSFLVIFILRNQFHFIPDVKPHTFPHLPIMVTYASIHEISYLFVFIEMEFFPLFLEKKIKFYAVQKRWIGEMPACKIVLYI